MTLPGASPPRGNFPPSHHSITSPPQGDRNDPLRVAVMALQHAAELEQDDQDIQALHKAIVIVQGVLANNGKDADAAIGITPALRHVRRQTAAGY